MFKYILFLILIFPCHAQQSNQEIIDYCTRTMHSIGGGNIVIWSCIREELKAQQRIIDFRKS